MKPHIVIKPREIALYDGRGGKIFMHQEVVYDPSWTRRKSLKSAEVMCDMWRQVNVKVV
jgi:hypothetical protein